MCLKQDFVEKKTSKTRYLYMFSLIDEQIKFEFIHFLKFRIYK